MSGARKPKRPALGMKLSRQDVAKVGAEAGVDPRTVERALCGSRQSGVVSKAIVAALRVHGFKAEAATIERAAGVSS